MAHILIVDPDAAARAAIPTLHAARHVCEEASGLADAVAAMAHFAAIYDPIDLLIVAEELPDGNQGLALLERLGWEACAHRVIWRPRAAADELNALAGRHGAIAQLAWSATPERLCAVIAGAESRLKDFLSRRKAWDDAIAYLDASSPALAIVQAHQRELSQALAAAGAGVAAVAAAFVHAEDTVNQSLAAVPGELPWLASPLQGFGHTQAFREDVEQAFKNGRLWFYELMTCLNRLAADGLAHGQPFDEARSHFSYPVGHGHRVYYRWDPACPGVRTLEAFGPEADWPATRQRLSDATAPPLPALQGVS